MADRGATSTYLTELGQPTNSPCHLIELYFDSGTDRITDGWRNVVWGANTYTSLGRMLSFSGVLESADMQIPTVTLSFSGVDQAYVALALSEPYLDRHIVIYRALIDSVSNTISSPVPIFDGRLDGMTIEDSSSGDSTIAISATSHWADFQRKPGRHTNSQEQGIYFPGDRFFEYCSQINKTIKWGAV
jgi:hypothetical protein